MLVHHLGDSFNVTQACDDNRRNRQFGLFKGSNEVLNILSSVIVRKYQMHTENDEPLS